MGPCPMSYILIFAAFFLDYKETVIGAKLYKSEDNIGTVLFEKSECGKRCWSSEEFAVLNSRRMFQDILPQASVINCQNDQYIAMLMDYFHICLECVRKLSIGKTKHLMLRALADTMGGYLKVHILPLTKHSYYAGNIKYHNAKRLFELFEELKSFLHTNGDGWRTSKNFDTSRVKTPPIAVNPSKTTSICDELIIYSSSERNRPMNHKKKRLTHHRRRTRRHSATGRVARQSSECVTIPLPFLDDNAQPNSVALPFRKDNLYSLYSEKSVFALVKYYVACVKCIKSKSNVDKKSLDQFNGELYNWLKQTVIPRLNDDKWYPAFGGVLRVMASLKESGYGGGNNKGKEGGGEYQVIPQNIPETNGKQRLKPDGSPLYNYGSLSFGTTELVVIGLASALLVWLLVGLSLVCYRFLTRSSEECGPCREKDPPIAVLYENEDYCVDETCPSKVSKKGFVEKLKEFWRKITGGCRGNKARYEDEERCLASMNYSSKDTVAPKNSNKCVQSNQYKKSVSRSTSPRERRPVRRTRYISDDFTTNSDSPT